jgi:hypothetical protein
MRRANSGMAFPAQPVAMTGENSHGYRLRREAMPRLNFDSTFLLERGCNSSVFGQNGGIRASA